MRRGAHLFFLSIAFAAASTMPAHAKDSCFTLPGVAGSLVFAIKDFSVPRKNKCKPVSGFSTIAGWTLDGTACATSDGSIMRFAIAGHPLDAPGPNPFHAGCSIPLPALGGGTCRGTYHSGSDVFGFTSTIDLQSCTAVVP